MAIATATAVALAAAAGSLGSAGMQSRAAGRAARGQQKSTAGAMRIEQQRDAEAKRRYDQQYADYERRRAEWDNARRQILGQRGIHVNNPLAAKSNGPSQAPSPTPAPAPGAPAPGTPAQGLSLGSMAGAGIDTQSPYLFDSQGGPAATPGPGTQPMTLGAMTEWSDWNNNKGRQ